jgi:ketosteroid isomerase-like protein
MELAEVVARLSERLREMEDREAIRNLVAGYGPSVDAGDSARAAAIWAQDGAYDVGGFGASHGMEAIAALFDGPTHQGLIAQGAAHLLSPLHIDLDGDVATAVGYSCVFVRDGDGWRAHRVAANRWTFHRTTGGWKAAERVNRLLDGGEEARALLAPPAKT